LILGLPKKIARQIKTNDIWLRDLALENPTLAQELDYTREYLKMQAPDGGLCIVCKGSKLLCGKTQCPVIARLLSDFKLWRTVDGLNIEGSSPPSVFVGRFGYPYVYAGPLTPSSHGDTSLLDEPERWFGRPMEEIIDFRSQLIRGTFRVHVKRFEDAGRLMDRTVELALSEHYVDTEMELRKKPRKNFYFDSDVQPIGPTAPLKDVEVGYVRWDHRMEKAYYDDDLKAAEAVNTLYERGAPFTKIQRAFSVGAFGIKKNRRLVPTRWSITAVDSILAKNFMDQIKENPWINEFEVYESDYLGNRFEVLLVPDAWSYEAFEAWYPKTLWNPDAENIAMITDWENHGGRWSYASMGGCYYSGRLVVAEHLARRGRQARAFILREAYPDYILPVGVWQVRENVKNAMRQKPLKFNTFGEAIQRVSGRLSIGLKHWVEASTLLKSTLIQKKMTDFL
jgi:hypothetical protein